MTWSYGWIIIIFFFFVKNTLSKQWVSSLFSWLEQFLNILSTISDPWNCHIEFPNTIDVFLKRKSYLVFLIHAWKIIKSEDLVYHVFMFQFLTIIDQFSCFCSQYYGILSRGEKKLDFLFYLVLQVHQHTFRPFHIFIFCPPWAKLAKNEK